MAAELPAGWATSGSPQTIFALTQEVPYNFGVVTQLLNETDERLQHRQHAQHLLPRRRACAGELVVDQLAEAMGKDPLRVPPRVRSRTTGSGRCSTRSPRTGDWGRSMPAGTAQGIAIHKEYKGVNAVPGRDRLPARRPSNRDGPRRRHRARGSPRS